MSGRVQRRQAERWAQQGQYPYAEPDPAPMPAPAAPAAAPIDQLKELAELRDKGVLTEEEFAAQKAKLLGS